MDHAAVRAASLSGVRSEVVTLMRKGGREGGGAFQLFDCGGKVRDLPVLCHQLPVAFDFDIGRPPAGIICF